MCVAVDHGQNADRRAVEQGVGDEVHGPGLIGLNDLEAAAAVAARAFAPGRLLTNHQAFESVEVIDTLVVHGPALPPQEHVQTAVAVAHARSGQLLETQRNSSCGSATER